MNFGNEDYNTFGGIPSSIIAYSGDRARYQTYDGIYDITTTTSQQIQTLQNQIVALQTSVQSLQQSTVSQIIGTNPNLLANGNCEQFTLNQPIIGTYRAGGSNEDFVIQGKCIPIFDRWYHVAELAALNTTNIKMSCTQVDLKNEISLGAAYDAAPRICKKGIYLGWSATTGNVAVTLEHTKPGPDNAKWGSMLGIQHMVPDVTLTVGKTYSLGFWIKSSYTGSGFIRILRQYNTSPNAGASNFFTGNALERVYFSKFDFVTGWNYIQQTFSTSSSLNGNSISGLNGLVVQIGPFHYTWWTSTNYTITGTIFQGAAGYGWVLSEIQLRQDTIAAKNNFPYNLREYENTREYICGTSPSTTCFSHATHQYIDRQIASSGSDWAHTYTVEYTGRVQYPNKMKSIPSLIIWNAKRSGGSPGLRAIAATYYNEDPLSYKSSASTNYFSQNQFSNDAYNSIYIGVSNKLKEWNQSLGVIQTDWVDTVQTPIKNRVNYITENEFVFEYWETLTFTDSKTCALILQEILLMSKSSLSGRFVMIVPEAHMGKPDPAANDHDTAVDWQFSAITSIPFP